MSSTLPYIPPGGRSSGLGNPRTPTPGGDTPRLPNINDREGNSTDDESSLEQHLLLLDERVRQSGKEYEAAISRRLDEAKRTQQEKAEKVRQEQQTRATETEESRVRREYQTRKAEREYHRQLLEKQKEEMAQLSGTEEELLNLKRKYKTLMTGGATARAPAPPPGSSPTNPRNKAVTANNGSPTSNGAAQITPQPPAAPPAAAPSPHSPSRVQPSNLNDSVTSNQGPAFKWVDGEESGLGASTLGSPTDQPDVRDARRASRRVAVSAKAVDADATEQFEPPVHYKNAAELEVLKGALQLNPLFSQLEREDLQIVIDAMEARTFHSGEIILREGHENNWFYVISTGTAHVFEASDVVKKLKEGQSFGELELLYNSPCKGTVCASSEVELWALDRDTYQHVVAKLHNQKRKLYEELLKKVPFLSGMSEMEALTLADALQPAYYTKGQHVMGYGAEGEYMHIVLEGEVEIIGRDDDGNPVHVCDFGYGETIGELEFINNHKIVADVVAKTPTVKTAKLNRPHFELCMGPVGDFLKERAMTDVKYAYYQNKQGYNAFDFDQYTEFNEVFDQSVSEVKRRQSSGVRRVAVSAKAIDENDDWEPTVIPKSPAIMESLVKVLTTNPLFMDLESEDIQVIAGAMRNQNFTKNTQILTTGEENEQFYIIASGEVVVIKKGAEICRFGPGRFFGELELMYSCVCVADVKATDDTETWVLDGETYRRIAMKTNSDKRKQYVELLGGVELLKDMSEYELMTLADCLQVANFKEGERLISFGEEGQWMHIIIDGEVEVWGRDEDNNIVNVCQFSSGESVGELEFINNHRCVADVVAKTNVKTVKLERQHFEMCMGPVVDLLKRNAEKDTYSYYTTFDWNAMPGMDEFQKDVYGDGNSGNKPDAGGSHTLGAPVPRQSNSRGTRRVAVATTVAAENADDFEVDYHEHSDATKAELVGVLSKMKYFDYLDPEDQEEFVDTMEPKQFKARETIIEEGSDSNNLIVLLRGTLTVSEEGKQDTQQMSPAVFCEAALMYSSPSLIGLTSSEDCCCYFLKRAAYQHLITKISKQRRELYESLLCNVSFLQSMSHEEMLQVADALQPQTFKEGDTIIKFGSEGQWMHIIVDGKVEVWGRDKEGSTINVCQFGTGDPIGELEFINNHPCVADVVAASDVKTVKLNRHHFELCMGPVVEILKKNAQTETYSYYANFNWDELGNTWAGGGSGGGGTNGNDDALATKKQSFTRRVGVTTRKVDQESAENYEPDIIPKSPDESEAIVNAMKAKSIFRELEPEVTKLVMKVMKKKNYKSGEHICTKGVEDENYYIVAEGEVLDESSDTKYTVGDSFHELELMYPSGKTHDVVATTDVSVFILDRQTYRNVVMQKSIKKRKLREDLLSSVGFLKGMSHTEMSTLADALQEEYCPQGEYLIRYGQEGQWMYIIMEGSVKIVGRDDFGKPVDVCSFGPGQPIGELEFINNHKTVADAVAETDVMVAKLNRRHFELVMGSVVDILKRNAELPEYTYYAEKLSNMRKQG